jgi:hypothetical protein
MKNKDLRLRLLGLLLTASLCLLVISLITTLGKKDDTNMRTKTIIATNLLPDFREIKYSAAYRAPVSIIIEGVVYAAVTPMTPKPVPGGFQAPVPDNDVGWMSTSSVPGGGSNIVLFGHSNVRGKVLEYLHTVEIGTEIKLYAADKVGSFIYEVVDIVIVPEKGQSLERRTQNARYMLPTDTETVTIITCINGDVDRLIVIGKLIKE